MSYSFEMVGFHREIMNNFSGIQVNPSFLREQDLLVGIIDFFAGNLCSSQESN